MGKQHLGHPPAKTWSDVFPALAEGASAQSHTLYSSQVLGLPLTSAPCPLQPEACQ